MKFKAQIISRIRRQASEIAKTDHADASRCCVNAEEINYAVCAATGPAMGVLDPIFYLCAKLPRKEESRAARTNFLVAVSSR
jgi:hypothetical protein